MLKDKRFLAIVPARIGSIGVRKKNIRLFNGRPLIYWALDSLTSLDDFDKIAVSTDSKEIADCVNKYGSGVEVWRRPDELATSNAHVMDTMQYHVQQLEKEGDVYDYVMMHHATAPLVDRLDVHKALNYLIRKDADFVVSMCKSLLSLGISRPVPDDMMVRGWFPKEFRGLNRQELPQAYELDNNIYVGKWQIFRDNIDYWDTNIYMYEMPQNKCADIDTEEDFKWAEIKFKLLLKEEKKHYHGIVSINGRDIFAKG